VALSLFAKTKGLSYPFRSPKQFGRRLANDMETMTQAGLEVASRHGTGGRLIYTIRLTEGTEA